MQAVVNNARMVAQINKAIDDAAEAGDSLSLIRVTEEEMKEFLQSPEFKMVRNPDSHYGQNSIPYPTLIDGVNNEEEVPRGCIFRGVRIVIG